MPMQSVTPSCAGHLQDVADSLSKAKKVVVVTGAGISTNLGIPDFRSENGLYAIIQAQYDAAAAVAVEKEKVAKEELKKSSLMNAEESSNSSTDLAADIKAPTTIRTPSTRPIEPFTIKTRSRAVVSSNSTPDLANAQASTTTRTPTTRPIEPFTIKTRSRAVAESQDLRIFTRSQSDLTGRQFFDNPDRLLRRTSSSVLGASSVTVKAQISRANPTTTSNPKPVKRSRSLDAPLTSKDRPEDSITTRFSKRLRSRYTPADTPTSSSSSKDTSPAPESSDSSEPSASITRSLLPKLKGKDLFDSMVWQDPLTTSIFLTFIAELRRQIRTQVTGTSNTHKFIKALRDGGRLVRNYTQNIDGLESREGLTTDLADGTGRRSRFFSGTLSRPRSDDGGGDNFGGCEVVRLHGGLDALRCSLCGEQSTWQRGPCQNFGSESTSTGTSTSASSSNTSSVPSCSTTASDSSSSTSSTVAPTSTTATASFSSVDQTINDYGTDGDESDREEILRGGRAPGCQRCIRADEARQHRGRRSVAVGKLRPDVVLYGEEHPEATLIGQLVTHDLSLGPDVILIMGTSLRVHGLKVMVKEFARAAHAKGGKVVFVNNTKPPESTWGDIIDYWVEMDCDLWVDDLKERRGELWLPQGLPVESKSSEESSIPRTQTSMPASSEPKLAAKPKRPQCQREDEMNGAYWAYQIQLNLEIIGGRPRTYAPNCNPHRKWGLDKWTRNGGKQSNASTPTFASSVPLKTINTNAPRPVKISKGKEKKDEGSRAAGSQLQRELSASVGPGARTGMLLPTPPPSDETEEPEETTASITPRTRERIKMDSSIERILSSPLAKRPRRG